MNARAITAGLQPTVSVTGPGGTPLGSIAAPSPGNAAILQGVQVATTGTYTITVGGLSGSLGLYDVQLTLNTALLTATNISLATPPKTLVTVACHSAAAATDWPSWARSGAH